MGNFRNNNRRPSQVLDFERLRTDLEKLRPDLERVLAGGNLSADRIIRATLTEVRNDERLLACDPKSILGCAVQAAQLGLEPGAALGQCYIASNRGQAVLRTYYRGLIWLVMKSGIVSRVDAQVVCENDPFDHEFGSAPWLRHKHAEGERGKPCKVYAIIYYRNGAPPAFEIMSVEEIEAIRDEYASDYSASPWKSEITRHEMYRKTPLRRLLKYQPQLGAAQQLAVMDEYAERGVDTGAAAAIGEPITPTLPTEDQPEDEPADEPPPPVAPPAEPARKPLPRAAEGRAPEPPKSDPARENKLRAEIRELLRSLPKDEWNAVMQAVNVGALRDLATADCATLERFKDACLSAAGAA